LRAIASICIVTIHLGYIFPSSIFDPVSFRAHRIATSDIVNFYILLLAVPLFFIVSNYLFSGKIYDTAYLIRRVIWYLKLSLFWSVTLLFFRYAGRKAAVVFPSNLFEGLEFILRAGRTPYYFFISLSIMTVIAHFAKKLSTKYLFICTILSIGVVSFAPLLVIRTHLTALTTFWSPLNFIPYPFIALVIHRLNLGGHSGQLYRAVIPACLALGIILAIMDWTVYPDEVFFFQSRFAIPAYMRPSLVFLGTGIFLASIHWTRWNNRCLSFMSENSLSLYCLHPFFVPLKRKSALWLGLSGWFELLIPLALVVIAAYCFSVILRYFLNADLLMQKIISNRS